MADPLNNAIVCPACGRRFRWKAELAGRQAKCSCGELIAVPAVPPGDELYDLAETAPTAPPPPMAKAATPAATKPAINYRAPAPAADQFSPDKLRDVQAPLALIAIGVIIEWVAAWLRTAHTSADLSATLIPITIEMVISTAVMLIAVYIAARLRGIQLGSFWAAVLKLAAISIAPRALVMLIFPILFCIPILGWLIGAGIEFCLFFALLGYFFDLDESDTWYCVMIMIIVSIAMTLARPLLLRWI